MGLDYNGDLQFDFLKRISEEITGGHAYKVSKAKELPQAFMQIYSENTSGAAMSSDDKTTTESNGKVQEYSFVVPNGSLFDVTVMLISNTKCKKIHLIDPDGADLTIPSNTVTRVNGDTFTSLKVARPKAGTWTVKYVAKSGYAVSAFAINNYDLELRVDCVDADDNAVTRGKTVELVAGFYVKDDSKKGSSLVKDERVLKDATVKLRIEDEKGKKVGEVDMNVIGTKATASYTFDTVGEYTIRATAENDVGGFAKESPEYVLSVKSQKLSSGLGIRWIWLMGTKKSVSLPYTKLLKFDSTAKVFFTQNNDAKLFAISTDGATLTVTPNAVGIQSCKLAINDSYGNNAKLTLTAIIISPVLAFGIIALIAILVLAAATIFIMNLIPCLNGKLYISFVKTVGNAVAPECRFSRDAANSNELFPAAGIIHFNRMRGIRRGNVKLGAILKQCTNTLYNDYCEYFIPNGEAPDVCDEWNTICKITICASRKKDMFIVRLPSQYDKEGVTVSCEFIDKPAAKRRKDVSSMVAITKTASDQSTKYLLYVGKYYADKYMS